MADSASDRRRMSHEDWKRLSPEEFKIAWDKAQAAQDMLWQAMTDGSFETALRAKAAYERAQEGGRPEEIRRAYGDYEIALSALDGFWSALTSNGSRGPLDERVQMRRGNDLWQPRL
jgi:hypothetical protein